MNRNRVRIVVGSLILIGLAIAAYLAFTHLGKGAEVAGSTTAAPAFTLTAYDRTQGNAKAPVVLIEYAAPVCPHCAEFNMQDFPLLKAKYIDLGKVYYVFRVYPIRPGDGPAEKLARCLPKDRYFAFIDLLFRNQPKWDADEYPGANTQTGLIQMARIAGMSAEDANRCMNDTTMNDAINKVGQDGAQKYNLTGTPTFVIDGWPGEGGEPWSALQSRLDAALASKKTSP